MTRLQNLFFMAKSYFQKRQVFALYLFFVFEHRTLFISLIESNYPYTSLRCICSRFVHHLHDFYHVKINWFVWCLNS